MTHSATIIVDGQIIANVDDADVETLAETLEFCAESIREHGIKATLRVCRRRERMHLEPANTGQGSTVVE